MPLLPLRDENPTRRLPVLTLGLIAMNVAAYVFQITRGPVTLAVDPANPVAGDTDLVCRWGAIPAVVFHNADASLPSDGPTCEWLNNGEPPFVSLLTSQFLHGSWWHLLGNMLFLWIFGNNIEDRLGRIRFVPFYLLGGVVAALAEGLSDTHSPLPLIGASGAIAALLGAYLVLFPRAKILTLVGPFPLRIPAWSVIGLFMLVQFVSLANEATPTGEGQTAYWAHVGGLVAGALLIKPFLAGRRPVELEPDLRGLRRVL